MILMAFLVTTVLSSNISYASAIDNVSTLHPEIMARPIIHDEIGDKGMVSFTLLQEVRKDPSLLSDGTASVSDVSSDLGPKIVDVLFSQKQRLDIAKRPGEENLRDVFMVPCVVADDGTDGGVPTSYYALLLVYNDGSMKAAVYDAGEQSSLVTALQGRITPEAVDQLLSEKRMQELGAREMVRSLSGSDEAVRLSVAFLNGIGASSAAAELGKIVDEKKLLLIETPAYCPGGIVIAGRGYEKGRAAAILGKLLSGSGIRQEDYKTALDHFCGLWDENEAGAFDVNLAAPGLKLLVAELEHGAGNEGYIRFHDRAYTQMVSMAGVQLGDCRAEIEDIRRVFMQVAVHDMPEELKTKYQIYRLSQEMEKAALAGDFTRAAEMRDRRTGIAESIGIKGKDELDKANREYAEIFSKIPGLDPAKIIIEDVPIKGDVADTGFLPTDRVSKDGEIRINGNFVKLMHRLKRIWGNVPEKELLEALEKFNNGTKPEKAKAHDTLVLAGAIFDLSDDPDKFDEPPKKFLGFLYPSILHSLAIHTTRGHFSVNSAGVALFRPDERSAQGERGKSHLYVNVLAMVYYWLVIVESEQQVISRVDEFILDYPEVFAGLNHLEKMKMPDHIMKIMEEQQRSGSWRGDKLSINEGDSAPRIGAWPFPQRYDDTAVDPDDIDASLLSGPDVVSNEGLPRAGASPADLTDAAKDEASEAGNEGYIRFHDTAYTEMMTVKGVELSDCKAEIADIKEIFRQVAEHDLPEGLKKQYEIYRLGQLMKEAGEKQDFAKAVELRDKRAEAAKSLGVSSKAALAAAIEGYEATFANVPGLNPEKITVKDVPAKKGVRMEGLVPTDRVTKDGAIELNGNFVKIMHRLKKAWGTGPEKEVQENVEKFRSGSAEEKEAAWKKLVLAGAMFEISDDLSKLDAPPKEMIGFLYPSIIHSLAIHTIRGHFSVDDKGVVGFNPDEHIAQKERGRGHLYTNVLAMMYYWILIVEMDTRVLERANAFMADYPEVFEGVAPEQRRKLADNLLILARDQVRSGHWKEGGAWPFPQYFDRVETNPENIESKLLAGPDVVSNEGLPHEGGKVPTAAEIMARMFEWISSRMSILKGSQILAEFGGMNPALAQSCLGTLVDMGVVLAAKMPGTGGMEYALEMMPEATSAGIRRIFQEETDPGKVKGKIYTLMEKKWAYAYKDATGRAVPASGEETKMIKEERSKTRIALETEWIPEGQEDNVRILIQEMLKKEGEEDAEVIWCSPEDKEEGKTLAGILKQSVPKEEYKDLVVMASRNNVEAGAYADFQGESFLVGVDPTELKKAAPEGQANYTRLLEMVVMAVRKSRGLPPIGDHAKIQCIEMKDKAGNVIERAYIFIPSADPVDLGSMREIFRAQAQTLHSL